MCLRRQCDKDGVKIRLWFLLIFYTQAGSVLTNTAFMTRVFVGLYCTEYCIEMISLIKLGECAFTQDGVWCIRTWGYTGWQLPPLNEILPSQLTRPTRSRCCLYGVSKHFPSVCMDFYILYYRLAMNDCVTETPFSTKRTDSVTLDASQHFHQF